MGTCTRPLICRSEPASAIPSWQLQAKNACQPLRRSSPLLRTHVFSRGAEHFAYRSKSALRFVLFWVFLCQLIFNLTVVAASFVTSVERSRAIAIARVKWFPCSSCASSSDPSLHVHSVLECPVLLRQFHLLPPALHLLALLVWFLKVIMFATFYGRLFSAGFKRLCLHLHFRRHIRTSVSTDVIPADVGLVHHD